MDKMLSFEYETIKYKTWEWNIFYSFNNVSKAFEICNDY